MDVAEVTGEVTDKVTEFNMDTIPDGSTILITCESNAGMSSVIHDILAHKSDIPKSVIFATKEHKYPQNAGTCFRNEYSSEHVEQDIVIRQSTIFDERHISPHTDRRVMAVFDDCFRDGAWTNDRCMKPFFTMSRSLAITSIFGLRQISGIPPFMIHGTDVLFIGKQGQEIERKRINDRFVHSADFSSLVDRYTNDYGFLVFHKGTLSHYRVNKK